ncbi:MAG: hypothetical protein Fur0043_24180 [Anaerolineales bacterium]
MPKKKAFLLGSLTLLALGLACRTTGGAKAGQPPSLSPTLVAGYAFTLPANQGWSDTGLQVQAGQTLRILYLSGLISDGRDALPDASGGSYVCGRADCCEPLPDAPRGALIGRAGGQAFYIGNGGELTMPADGFLQLRVNDCDSGLYDNRGALNLLILP